MGEKKCQQIVITAKRSLKDLKKKKKRRVMYKAHVFKCVFIIFMENAKVLDKETYKLQSVNRCTYIEKTHLVSA